MSILILGKESQTIVEEVIKYAEAHRLGYGLMKFLSASDHAPVGDNPRFCCVVPHNLRCVFTIEEHPLGWCRHLSVSILGKKKLPAPEILDELMKMFKFFGDTRALDATWIEKIGTTQAINIVQRYDRHSISPTPF